MHLIRCDATASYETNTHFRIVDEFKSLDEFNSLHIYVA